MTYFSFNLHPVATSLLSNIRTCYFTSDSTMKRSDFMKMLNSFFPGGGLTCSLLDHQLSEFIQIKKRNVKELPTKRAVSVIGPQNADLWVLGPSTHISSNGELVEESDYIWVSDLYAGPGVADSMSACNISLPLTAEPLGPLLNQLMCITKHNFFPSLLMIGSCAMALHYNTVKDKLGFCPVPIGFGNPGTGKTTALKCGLAMMGLLPHRLWSNGTREMFVQLCCAGYMPLGIDDPKSKAIISELVMTLFGGANECTIGRGSYKPTSMAVISANFTVNDMEKYVKHYLMYNFLFINVD